MTRNDEHTLNTALAACLRRRSPLWGGSAVVAEDLRALSGPGRPDILVEAEHAGPVVIETEFAPARTVEADARGRVGKQTSGDRPIEHALAVKVSERLRNAPPSELEQQLEQSTFAYCVCSADEARFPVSGWLEGGVDEVATLVEALAVSERAVARSTDVLQEAVTKAARYLMHEAGLGPDVLPRIGRELSQDPDEQTVRMALTIIANACTFHAILAGHHGIRSFSALREEYGIVMQYELLDEWRAILKVNYFPIFHTARKVLLAIPSKQASEVLTRFSHVAEALLSLGASRSHDLTGRMFQRLIQDRKFLATFYTRPEAATLLAELAVGMTDVDWSDPKAMTRLRVADLACGTGTLMSSAYHALIRRYRRAGHDDRKAHRAMMENALVASDIMPAAAHLTGAMLSSVHPAELYEGTQVYALPYGSHPGLKRIALGALSLIGSGEVLTLFRSGLAAGIEKIGGKVGEKVSERDAAGSDFALADESLDLVIMNPPFTRPTNHARTDESVPSFAGFGNTAEEQAAMSAELKRLRTLLAGRPDAGPPASHGNAGLASNFVDLSHEKLRPGGTLALVMPAALVLGNSWAATRALLARHYEEIIVVSLAGARGRDASFSADTQMGEVLLLARKRKRARRLTPGDAEVTWVSFAKRPASAAEALVAAQVIRKQLSRDKDHFEVTLGDVSAGLGMRASLADGGLAGLADAGLGPAILRLTHGVLPIPRTSSEHRFPIALLGEFGTRGPLHRDVGTAPGAEVEARGPFKVVPLRGAPPFPALWAHRADRERKLVVEPDCMGVPRTGREADAAAVWKTATRLHFTLDFGLGSQSLAACLTPEPVIGGTAWPSFLTVHPAWEKPLAAWANTTLGLLLFWWAGSPQQAGRTRLTITRLPDLPVVDLRKISADQLAALAAAFDAVADCEFLPAHRAHEDPVRKELDRSVLQDALGFPDAAMEQVGLLRQSWCAEPTVHGGKNR